VVAQVTIGEFATITRLSRKALRHYHELGLLEPAAIDQNNGYRYYDAGQIETARIIRRLRQLDLPVPELKAYLAANDEPARNVILSAHLSRLQAQLRQTEVAVAALQALVAPTRSAPPIEVRELPATTAVAITATVTLAEVIDWWSAATRELADVLAAAGTSAAGPLGASYDHALFADEQGEVTVWFPTDRALADSGRVRAVEIPGGRFAVTVHDGPDSTLDDTYAALGHFVAGAGISRDGPVRERYLAGVLDDPAPIVTEVSWPVR
jgi:DNA-binding transcriptional MerR regulator